MPIYEFEPFSLNATERLLLRDGRVVPLKPKILDLLLALVEHSGHILGNDVLMKQVWPDSFVEESNLTVSISALRKVLGKGKDGRAYIENIPKRGYRFVACVVTLDNPAYQRNLPADGKRQAGSGRPLIAVLPFKHIGSNEDDAYLGLGITDALITRLSNVRQVIVRPTSAVRKYQEALDPITAGQELRVESVLDGSIRRSGKRIRVTVQMISIADGASLWADKFDEEFTDIFDVEDSISEQMTKALMLRLTREEKELLGKHHTKDTQAYQAYWRGRYCSEKRMSDSLKKAIEYFQQAIEIDPNYALAYCGLADSYIYVSALHVLSPKQYLPKAEEAALKAIELDDTLAEAHTALGLYKTQTWDWSNAEREFRRAIELNPNYAVAHQRYATCLRLMGRFNEAEIEIRKALELNPLSSSCHINLGFQFLYTRQYDRAIEQLRGLAEWEPNLVSIYVLLGLAYEQKKMHEAAITEYKKALNLKILDIEISAYIGCSYATFGRKDKAQKVLEELMEVSPQRYVEPFFIALLYTSLGQTDEAFVWLEKAYEEHFLGMGVLKIDPMLDRLRDDPRFESLLERMGLANDLNCG